MTKNNPNPRVFEAATGDTTSGRVDNALLIECAWEVCNQVGGIYTVLRSKAPTIVEKWGKDYCLLGPYVHPNVSAFFEPTEDYDDPFGLAVIRMREMGYEVHYGNWMIGGKPKVVLFNPAQVDDKLGEIKYELWDHHNISTPTHHPLINQVVAFGFLVKTFLLTLSDEGITPGKKLIAHMHEWMAATAIPGIRRNTTRMQLVFTTHATLLGRYLAMNDPEFYQHLPFYNWEAEAKKFGIETETNFERAAAHGSHVFTTVSEVTGRECEQLLGRKPDVILPNGLNIQRFVAPHEIQNLHQDYKDEIHKFVQGHFFQSTPFNLDRVLYFFTSGRYEYKNKGFDITLEALTRLNHRMKQEGIDKTVVMFFITKGEVKSINPHVMESRAMLNELQATTEAIKEQIGERLFTRVAKAEDSKFPDLNELLDEYWKIRLRRNLQIWKNQGLPSVVTHDLVDDSNDPILQFLREAEFYNKAEDRVKIVFHPDFINSANPLFGIEYPEFVRGCHLGVFPSYYEPWGYTPLECMASGVPAVTSNLAGFGSYSLKNIPNPELHGLYVVNRRDLLYHNAADQLADQLYHFVTLGRRERIEQRYKVEEAAMRFDWNSLTRHYDAAYALAAEREG